MVPSILGQARFEPYGASHWVVLAFFVAAAALLVRRGRAQRGTPAARAFSRSYALCVLAVAGGFQLYSMLPRHWDLGRSLPFQLCDLAWMACAWALWTHRFLAYSLLYYWGLTLTSQALLTPVLELDFPNPQFLMFWASHLLVVLAAIYMTWGLGFRPSWQGWRFAAAATVGWMAIMFLFNAAAGTNYLYVNAKPPGRSLLDVLGPWPWYLASEIALTAAVWALITLPWVGWPRGGNPR